ncbi:MAG: 1-acyl-sn-glycerol-3-phosphate acyltransferase, partial [Lachnospiraceae bacterium]|nr:1-acyl-sn-glycerol-3-phosphate acyltransferase [Lachnospiraceae bacterium]
IDSDTVVLKDIAELYEYELDNNYIGAVRDQIVMDEDVFGNYAEKVLGISRAAYFNAGVVLINCELFRKKNMLKQFIDLLNTYSFVVAQDQDYLNMLCKEHVRWLDGRWNVQISTPVAWPEDQFCIIHYNLAVKPWHYKDCKYGNHFWDYAQLTPAYKDILNEMENYSPTKKKQDVISGDNLLHLALDEIHNENNYFNVYGDANSPSVYRTNVLNKIRMLEKEGRFDEDCEADPPGRELKPWEIDYLKRSIKQRTMARYAFRIARWFAGAMIAKHQLIIKNYVGLENYKNLRSGAVITCNHFHPMDSFAMHITYEKAKQRRKRKLFRVIKEGNYTSFPGFFGFLMRNCNTLPLSSNKETMRKFIFATDQILQKGHFILVYPEQSLWWNYRKPKPLKKGAFTIAARNHVPVLPCFITMEDSAYTDSEGFPVQEYTVHIAPPIYPDPNKKLGENVEMMMRENEKAWKNIYEKTYGIPLTYTCNEEDAV